MGLLVALQRVQVCALGEWAAGRPCSRRQPSPRGARRLQLKASAKAGYASRSWFEFPWALRNVPLEPFLKVVLPFIGGNMEIWAGHTSYRCLCRMHTCITGQTTSADPARRRKLYAADGRFELGNMQDWQHAAMYSAFCVSGLVDLIGFYLPGVLPAGTEHVRPLPLHGAR